MTRFSVKNMLIKQTIDTKLTSKKGFTLIELMVVMAVIAILAVMGMSGYGTVQIRARDARRRADMQVVQRGFEQYHAATSSYQACSTMGTVEYFPAGLPADPLGASHAYTQSCTAGTGYCWCGLMERDGTGNAGANCNYLAADKDYFCVSQLQ